MHTHPTTRRQLGLAAIMTAALALAGCGGGDDDGQTAAPEDGATATETSAVEATTDDGTASVDDGPGLVPSDLEPGPWAAEMIDAWAAYQQARTDNAAIAVHAMTTDAPRFEWTQDLLPAERDAADAALDAMPGVPDDDMLAGPYRDLVAALTVLRDAAADGYELGQSDPEGLAAELEEAGDDLPAAEYGRAYISFVDADNLLSTACFAVQEQIAAADLGILDCAGSRTDTDASGAAAAPDDPTITATGMVAADLEPGTHDFTVFEPGLQIETTRLLRVMTEPESIEFEDPESSADFLIAAAGRFVADPAASGELDPGLMSWIELPDDVGSWLAELPVEITGTGTVPIRTTDAPYWDLVPADDFPGPMPLAVFNGEPTDEQFAGLLLVPGAQEYLRLIEWRRDTDRLLIAMYVVDSSIDYEAFLIDVMSGVG